jgi:hypothetical protein
MKIAQLITWTLATATFALPAAAQGAGNTGAVTAPATRSDTKLGKTEWYRQFAQPKPADAKSLWQAEPSDDFSMVIGDKDRWQLSFDKLSRPYASVMPREQVQAGATFRISPRFSVGGELSVGSDELGEIEDQSRWQKDDVEAGIRLKSAFKF